ncbi:hypothetical protein D5R81_19560 [Parashewanella spongiae]|uniref:Uncharacterized protein n=1 Tax=Parashewanella spongiae TaxID=342950 RepID=A0A3A6SU54_9GAMM|nr:hypothetical protein [Parashewanella spongiae]MCL1080217.1 hypothetical protein [Parashewanella spongiae]RJY02116.1 hypothetical protein D5R81_19560 [Parashewanella spongiae]
MSLVAAGIFRPQTQFQQIVTHFEFVSATLNVNKVEAQKYLLFLNSGFDPNYALFCAYSNLSSEELKIIHLKFFTTADTMMELFSEKIITHEDVDKMACSIIRKETSPLNGIFIIRQIKEVWNNSSNEFTGRVFATFFKNCSTSNDFSSAQYIWLELTNPSSKYFPKFCACTSYMAVCKAQNQFEQYMNILLTMLSKGMVLEIRAINEALLYMTEMRDFEHLNEIIAYMRRQKIKPEAKTYACLFTICRHSRNQPLAQELWGESKECLLNSHSETNLGIVAINAFINACSTFHDYHSAFDVWNWIEGNKVEFNLRTLNSLIMSCNCAEHLPFADFLHKTITVKNWQPNWFTYSNYLTACVLSKNMSRGKLIGCGSFKTTKLSTSV